MATLAQASRAIPAARISRVLVLAAVLVLALAGLMMLGLLLGTPQLAPNDLGVIANGGGERLARIVVTQLRLPRVLLGAGAAAC
jgi:ABC-type enterobactin transport system permease subunit